MAEMLRIMVFDNRDQFITDLDPRKILGAQVTLEINGEHSLTITTLQELEKTNRVVLRDNLGTWHEFVVAGLDEEHSQGGGAIARTYYCVWSLEYDTSGTYINDQFGCGVVPGHPSVPQPARRGLECALEGTARWQIGTITVTQQGSASFYRMSGWEGLKKVVERWGGELQATITVSTTGVVERHVDLLQHVGASAEEATRRFDYGSDLTKIKRTVHDEVWPCRVVPLGRSQETEAGGYTRRPGIASVNDGVDWLIDDEVADLVKVPDGSGGWEYPCAIIKNDQFEEPADIKAWALGHISEYTRPKVTYTAEVAQFAEAGLSAHEVELGDRVAVVDRTFMEGGLRIAVRVVKMKQDLLDPSGTTLIIGNAQQTLAGQLDALAGDISSVYDQSASASDWQNGSAYMNALIGRLNDEINQTGGYWYMVPGIGTRTYDVPVADPASGLEANQVVEIRGGNIRIANSKTAGNWNWRTLIQSGLVVADTVKALNVSAGIIQSFDGSGYWDLDNSVFRFNFELESVLYVASLTVDSYQTVTSASISGTYAHGDRYLVAFTTTRAISRNLRAALYVSVGESSGSPYFPESVTPVSMIALTGDSSSGYEYRYAAVLDGMYSSNPIYLCLTYISQSKYDEGSAYNATDVRVYKLPNSGSGIINLSARNSDGDDGLGATVRAGSIEISEGRLTTMLSAGRLSLGSSVVIGGGSSDYGDQPSAVDMGTWCSILYLPRQELRIGPSNDPMSYNKVPVVLTNDTDVEGDLAAEDITASGAIAGTSVSATSITASGTVTAANLTLTANKTKNYVLAAPSGANGAPTFRKLVADDIPGLPASQIYTGTLSENVLPTIPTTKGGTGVTGRQTGTVTSSPSVSIYNNVNHCWHNGIVCTVAIAITLSFEMTSAGDYSVATVPVDFRPPHAVFGSLYLTGTTITGNVFAVLKADGTISLNNRSGGAIGTGTHIYMSFTFAM